MRPERETEKLTSIREPTVFNGGILHFCFGWGVKQRPARRADNLTAICVSTV
jgi:hypothetical protein